MTLPKTFGDELDRLAQEAVEGSGVVSATTEPPADAIDIRQALLSETKRAVTSLTKPATLASVAANVQAAFGTDVVGTWGGFGSFANLVRAAVPSASISTNPPGVVTPPGFIPVEATETSTEVFDEATPMVVQRIHAFDRTMPTIYGERLGALIDGLERCLTSEAWFKVNLQGSPQGLRDINALSKYARDTAPEAAPVSNKNLNYMLRLLSYNHSLQPGLTRDEIRQLIQTGLLVRAQKLGVVEDLAADREAIEQWLEV